MKQEMFSFFSITSLFSNPNLNLQNAREGWKTFMILLYPFFGFGWKWIFEELCSQQSYYSFVFSNSLFHFVFELYCQFVSFRFIFRAGLRISLCFLYFENINFSFVSVVLVIIRRAFVRGKISEVENKY